MKRSTEAVLPKRESESGAALVELSVVMSLLMFLILGGISFGVVLARGQVLQQASGEASRAVSLAIGANPSANPTVVANESIRRFLKDNNACGPGSAVTCPVTAPAPCSAAEGAATCISVTVRHDRSIDSIVGRLPLIDRVLPASLSAKSSARVR